MTNPSDSNLEKKSSVEPQNQSFAGKVRHEIDSARSEYNAALAEEEEKRAALRQKAAESERELSSHKEALASELEQSHQARMQRLKVLRDELEQAKAAGDSARIAALMRELMM